MWWLRRAWEQAKLAILVLFPAFVMFFAGYALMIPDFLDSPAAAVLYGLGLNCVLWYGACYYRNATMFSHDAIFTYLTPLSARRLLLRTMRLRWPLQAGAWVVVPAAMALGAFVAYSEMPRNRLSWNPIAVVNVVVLYYAVLLGPVAEIFTGSKSPLAAFFLGKYLRHLPRKITVALVAGVAGILWYTGGAAFAWVQAAIERVLDFGNPGIAFIALFSPVSSALAREHVNGQPVEIVLTVVWSLVVLVETRAIGKVVFAPQQELESKDFERWQENRERWTLDAEARAIAEDAADAKRPEYIANSALDETEPGSISTGGTYDETLSPEAQLLRQLEGMNNSKGRSFRESPQIAYTRIKKYYIAGLALVWLGWLACREWWPNAYLFGNVAIVAGMLRALASGGWWRNSLWLSFASPIRVWQLFARTVRRDLVFNAGVDAAAAMLVVLARPLPLFCFPMLFLALQVLGCCAHLNTWVAATSRSGRKAAGQIVLGAQGLWVAMPYAVIVLGRHTFGGFPSDWRTWAVISCMALLFLVCDILVLIGLHRRADTSLLRTI